MESELFGHEKGAFTGAATAKPGKFELANGGTLFLDEIGELSPSLQAKLLRVLQEKEFFRVGGVKLIKSNARVITATHRPIKQMVKEGSFREDLFFRLNVLSFELLPLNKRKEDIPVLINHFWEKLCAEFGKKLTLSDEVLEALVKYDYPGNVREMKNVLERLVVLSTESAKIDLDLLPKEFHSFSVPKVNTMNNPSKHMQFGPNSSLTELTGKFEAQIITDAMIQTNNNQVKASKLLGITRGALQYKLKKYEIDVTQNSLAKKEAA
jgi:transcriptional regulator with PAS, ATPase and Fis domain